MDYSSSSNLNTNSQKFPGRIYWHVSSTTSSMIFFNLPNLFMLSQIELKCFFKYREDHLCHQIQVPDKTAQKGDQSINAALSL